MSARLARTADGWWAMMTPAGLVRLDLPAATTAELLAGRTALAAAIEAAQAAAAATPAAAVPAESLDLLSPVTAPARVVAQAVNYRSHAIEGGFDPDTVPAGQRGGPSRRHHRGHDRPAGPGADPAIPLPADGPRRPAADRHAGGTALRAPAKLAGTLAGLLPPATRWKLFFGREAGNPRYLRDGDVITAAIASPDGRLDLGTQRTTVVGKSS